MLHLTTIKRDNKYVQTGYTIKCTIRNIMAQIVINICYFIATLLHLCYVYFKKIYIYFLLSHSLMM